MQTPNLEGALMRKLLIASAAIAGLAGSTFASNVHAASGSEPVAPSAAQIQQMQDRESVLLDSHLAGMKAGLKLNEEQAKNWPAFEAAIREMSKARWGRTREALDRVTKAERPSPIERMTIMADHLEKSAADLRKVVDAGTPLYASLNDAQKSDFGPLMRQFKPSGQH
jgi:zinc resistance-associated protein